MADALIPADLLEDLVTLDESAMPSAVVVLFRTKVDNPRGGSSLGDWTPRNATPIPCRVVPGVPTARSVGEQMQSVGDVTVQIALTGMQAQSIVVQSDDELSVTTTVSLPGTDLTVTERYKVKGEPSTGSYGTNLSVPCVKVS